MPSRGRFSDEDTPPPGGWPNRLYELRKKSGLSTHELARLVKPPTTGSTIVKLQKGGKENGGTQLTVQWMQRLASALNCHPSDLLPDQPAGVLNEGERAFVDQYRRLPDDDRAAIERQVHALVVSRLAPSPVTFPSNGGKRKTPAKRTNPGARRAQKRG